MKTDRAVPRRSEGASPGERKRGKSVCWGGAIASGTCSWEMLHHGIATLFCFFTPVRRVAGAWSHSQKAPSCWARCNNWAQIKFSKEAGNYELVSLTILQKTHTWLCVWGVIVTLVSGGAQPERGPVKVDSRPVWKKVKLRSPQSPQWGVSLQSELYQEQFQTFWRTQTSQASRTSSLSRHTQKKRFTLNRSHCSQKKLGNKAQGLSEGCELCAF